MARLKKFKTSRVEINDKSIIIKSFLFIAASFSTCIATWKLKLNIANLSLENGLYQLNIVEKGYELKVKI